MYVLLVRVSRRTRVRVGRLGELVFKPGLYAYIGSAQSGLSRRIERHHRKEKRLHWHIDYLLSEEGVDIEKVYVLPAGKEWECKTARLVADLSTSLPVEGFGCSDCGCNSHLYLVEEGEVSSALEEKGFKIYVQNMPEDANIYYPETA